MAYVYIASPYSKGDQIQNVRTAILAADELSIAGHIPFIPVLSHFWHFLCPHRYEFWLDQDVAWLLKCDCILRLPGESSGADSEVRIAKDNNIPVYFTIKECLDALVGEE